ncbi:hypothetical protein AAFC00_005486 [Neodothiora populina]|uniref:G-patch domain-containing protein n=1 Tax=Neodothiora populina TaxID=2781224 RepID=A0ABR3PLA6_9PEZI
MSSKRSRANYEADHLPPFALYGTPLPPLDSETRDDGSYVPLWKQEVRDERGRKRLHGAFTGGFSAGYFNTVGSKEGWTPSTFISSRGNRAKDANAEQTQQKAGDFMDDEDLADAAEAQKLETQASFSGLGSTQEEGMRRGLLSDLFKPAADTIGVKLLQKMGWRQGQGIGPRVRRKAETGEDNSVEAQGTHLFAPANTHLVKIDKKKDRFGLGYAREERLQGSTAGSRRASSYLDDNGDDDDSSSFTMKKPLKVKQKPKRGAFGVGVLNDTGSDDEDPYEMGPKISYNRIIGGDKKKRKGGIVANTASPAVKAAPTFMSRKLGKVISNTGFRKCYDGRLPLDGFVLASQPLITDQENKYPPPSVPEGWESSKNKDPVKPADPSTFKSTADVAKASTLDPASRAAVLGEQQLPGKSIFDYLSSSARERLVNATGRTNLPQARNDPAPAGFERTEAQKNKILWDLVPVLDKSTATSALQRGSSGSLPYSEDLGKRARYRAFLEIAAGISESLPIRAKDKTTDEWISELREFCQVAQIFRPISGLMASRFTTASSSSAAFSTHGQKSTSSSTGPSEQAAPKAPQDPAVEAAKLGMFGPMTRSRTTFYPTRLLCKRFGVKTPSHADPGSGPGSSTGGASNQDNFGDTSSSSRLDVVSKASLDQIMQEANRLRSVPKNDNPVSSSSDAAQGQDDSSVQSQSTLPAFREVKVQESIDPETNSALEAKRAGDEVFKSIFGDSDDDDDD